MPCASKRALKCSVEGCMVCGCTLPARANDREQPCNSHFQNTPSALETRLISPRQACKLLAEQGATGSWASKPRWSLSMGKDAAGI